MSAAAKVGLFMLIILVIAGFFILKIQDIQLQGGGATKTVKAVFDSVAGLDVRSAVRVAGVRVGKVSDIELTPDGRAVVTLELNKDVQLHQGASARVTDLGLLGEKYVELDPGSADAPVIQLDNGEQAKGNQVVLPGKTTASIDQVTNQISAIADDVKAITASMRTAMAGPGGEQRLAEIVENVRLITAEVRHLIEANRSNVASTADNIRVITADLRVEIPKIAASIDALAGSMGDTVGDNRDDVREIVRNLRALSADLRTTDQNLNAITGQIRSGEGTVGKLIYSDEAHERLNGALASVESGVNELKDTLGKAAKLKLDLGMKADYYAGLHLNDESGFNGNSRSAVVANLIPDPEQNRFYHLELADTPRGHRNEKIVETTVTGPTGGETTITTEQVRYDHGFVLSAQAGWRLDPRLAVRLGLFDSTGGVGADYSLSRRLSVTGEAFDFSKRYDDKPHIRLFGEYILNRESKTLPEIFVTSGVDNLFNDSAFIVGGGIRWTDDDLKYLLGSIPGR